MTKRLSRFITRVLDEKRKEHTRKPYEKKLRHKLPELRNNLLEG